VGGHARERDAHRPHFSVIGGNDCRPGATERVEHFLGWVHERPTRRRQTYRTGVAVEQRRPELAFQLFDRPAQWRLSDVQPLGGASEVQFLGHCQE
jgi:hypothetical protein